MNSEVTNRALQPKIAPQCPECLRVFGIICGETIHTDGNNITYAPLENLRDLLPAVCQCGWQGMAQFVEPLS